MKLKSTSFLLSICILSLSGCAVTSGLQTYDLPEQGHFRTDQGADVSVVQLTQANLPALQLAENATPSDLASLFRSQHSLYRLSAGDVLSIQLWAYPELTPPLQQDSANIKASGYPIDSDGNIYLPLVGKIHAAGKTVSELNRNLRAQFAHYLKTPDVVVRVLSYEGNRYFVNGQVMKSGQYTLNDQPISIYTALGMAGGVNTETGDNTSIQLIRNGKTFDLNAVSLEKQGYSLHKLLIQPNDTIYVNTKQNQKLYVMGESSKSQALSLRDQGMTLSDVLGESEGINPYSASAARIYVMRTNLQTRTSTIYHLDLSSIGNLALANQFQMQKNDIVYIDATGLTRWQRIMNQIVPFSSALYTFDQLGKN
ncbi:polysaccharide biosynthesis/export family protein [Acinetobacter ursingii]|uniref:polysaccharide biosynthesis/export family protein n=1 Tax=Acinetobacter ursingii TaxID=108980 RepID=UPI0021CD9B5A|nr:polysaccharide biosynthesis/export family protein [Acinetobacter ursingii]MCU4306308.1 polysaccharide biosynthesis/export family protein [Acinetobacter ursingii]MCU4371849.1 polysaccharide biosynthesis/export family protein [Acinetobacter ursingii]MDG9992983.1 polysaccharide biosynthesis/export family protein [Acinetobacter ursingii]MDH0203764.1 polysaccharide biosynthesis/export family protein [Acinetobacter ursingii]